MSIGAGTLNKRMRIVKDGPGAVDALNQPLGGDANEVTVCECWGSIRAANGRDLVGRDGAIDADVGNYSIRIRYRPEVRKGMRVILASGVVFKVEDVSHDHGSREWTDMACADMPDD